MRIDFQELKESITIEQIIAWLNIDLKKTGTHQLRGVCPIHGGSNDRQFVVSTDKNLWGPVPALVGITERRYLRLEPSSQTGG